MDQRLVATAYSHLPIGVLNRHGIGLNGCRSHWYTFILSHSVGPTIERNAPRQAGHKLCNARTEWRGRFRLRSSIPVSCVHVGEVTAENKLSLHLPVQRARELRKATSSIEPRRSGPDFAASTLAQPRAGLEGVET